MAVHIDETEIEGEPNVRDELEDPMNFAFVCTKFMAKASRGTILGAMLTIS